MKLILASKSPRRRELITRLGYPVEFVDIDVDEHVDPATPPADIPQLLALRKSHAYPRTPNSELLIAADTIVLLDNTVLGKPADRNEAVSMLHRLSGRRHTVYTGVCLRSADKEVAFTEATDVIFRPLADSDIDYYVDHCQPYDKAGAYGIQEWIGMVGIERIEGCYYNVVGLPLPRLCRALREEFGYTSPK